MNARAFAETQYSARARASFSCRKGPSALASATLAARPDGSVQLRWLPPYAPPLRGHFFRGAWPIGESRGTHSVFVDGISLLATIWTEHTSMGTSRPRVPPDTCLRRSLAPFSWDVTLPGFREPGVARVVTEEGAGTVHSLRRVFEGCPVRLLVSPGRESFNGNCAGTASRPTTGFSLPWSRPRQEGGGVRPAFSLLAPVGAERGS